VHLSQRAVKIKRSIEWRFQSEGRPGTREEEGERFFADVVDYCFNYEFYMLFFTDAIYHMRYPKTGNLTKVIMIFKEQR